MLKKQTVWLLTMLSLVVVLSVYYITSPDGASNEAAVSNGKQAEKKETGKAGEKQEAAKAKSKDGQETAKDGSSVSTVQDDDLFTSIRMEQEDARSAREEELKDTIASNAPIDRKNEAYSELKVMSDTADKESLLEKLIKSKNYDDALVRIDGGKVRITVKADKQSAEAANDILMLVRGELSNMEDVAVNFEPAK
ncbi:SpoIIIAH-like family protein [Metabacillus sp. GX 13764]|uniref:SpoIIIAH-like family protein n=1 Tax=Metabacillus kandeliae TaxID=2900151 RepID=UPI001E50A1C8|nr:SpoIIIAH-like family protein [Metabacillus kandeliae]MCD7033203.1 SpoIIIAH-like family protein [Metabacillus kandeliae]